MRIIALMLAALCVSAMAATNDVHITLAECSKATTGWGVVGNDVSCDGDELTIGEVQVCTRRRLACSG